MSATDELRRLLDERGVEYETNDGEVRTRLNVCQVVDAQRVRDGMVKAREPKKLAKTSSTIKTTDVYSGEIPFD